MRLREYVKEIAICSLGRCGGLYGLNENYSKLTTEATAVIELSLRQTISFISRLM